MQLNLRAVKSFVAEVAGQTGSQVAVIAVSKTQTVDAIRSAWAAGQVAFAENYLQEALEKMAQLADLPIEWHFIGPLQSNKTRAVAERFAWVHTLDREKIAQRLSEARPAGIPPLNICVQVNISGEETKHGVPPEDAEALCHAVAGLPGLSLRGLMTIGRPGLDEGSQRRQFRAMKSLFDQINGTGLAMDTLSMGMSDDMRAAILEGSTLVRVGTAIFGERPQANRRDAETQRTADPNSFKISVFLCASAPLRFKPFLQ